LFNSTNKSHKLYNELILNSKDTHAEKNAITPIQNKIPLKNISEKEFEELRKLGLDLISQGKGNSLF